MHLMFVVAQAILIICTGVSCASFTAKQTKHRVSTLSDKGKFVPNSNKFYVLQGPHIHKHELTGDFFFTM